MHEVKILRKYVYVVGGIEAFGRRQINKIDLLRKWRKIISIVETTAAFITDSCESLSRHRGEPTQNPHTRSQ